MPFDQTEGKMDWWVIEAETKVVNALPTKEKALHVALEHNKAYGLDAVFVWYGPTRKAGKWEGITDEIIPANWIQVSGKGVSQCGQPDAWANAKKTPEKKKQPEIMFSALEWFGIALWCLIVGGGILMLAWQILFWILEH